MIGIEVDGGIHQKQNEADTERTIYLEYLGLRIIRFTNEEILNDIEFVKKTLFNFVFQDSQQSNVAPPVKGA